MARFLFTIQGEGRGHLTQAIAFKEHLESMGHQVIGIGLGAAKDRNIPSFFQNEMLNIPMIQFPSPYLNFGQGKSVNIGRTLWTCLCSLPKYIKSIQILGRFIDEHQPDAIINFYESITGWYYLKTQSKLPCLAIGHQFLLLNQYFDAPKINRLEQFCLNLHTKLNGFGATRYLGLSFYDLEDDLDAAIYTVPPLLRKELQSLSCKKEPFFLVYLTQYRLSEEILLWHKKNQHVSLVCFWDHPEHKYPIVLQENLLFHPIDGKKYLEYMSKCSGLMTTAGFESVAEALYLGKPVLMVPVPNHIEQKINAVEGERTGAGLASNHMNLDQLILLEKNFCINKKSEAWFIQTHYLLACHVNAILEKQVNLVHQSKENINDLIYPELG